MRYKLGLDTAQAQASRKHFKRSKRAREAEFRLPDDEETVFCEDHVIEYLNKEREPFLPRIPQSRIRIITLTAHTRIKGALAHL